MATRDEIEDALACADCCDVVEDHLRHCEPDECGVVESYRRVMARVEAGDHADWRSPARSAMTVMMTAEPWMHEHHDHRVVHDDKPITLDDVMDQRPRSAPAREWMAHLARERLARLKAARTTPAATSTPVVVDRPDPPLALPEPHPVGPQSAPGDVGPPNVRGPPALSLGSPLGAASGGRKISSRH